MSNKTQGQKVPVSGWDEAIKHAQGKIRQLRLSIQVFQTRRDTGEPWPPSAATNPRREDRAKDTKPSSLGHWEAALEEAERQILGHRRSILQLRGSVEIFKKKIASCEVWPGRVQKSGQGPRAKGPA